MTTMYRVDDKNKKITAHNAEKVDFVIFYESEGKNFIDEEILGAYSWFDKKEQAKSFLIKLAQSKITSCEKSLDQANEELTKLMESLK